MTTEEIKKLFDEYNDYDVKEKINHSKSKNNMLNVFLILSDIIGENRDIIQAAEHDAIYLCDIDDLEDKITKEQIQEFAQCGVIVEDDFLALFV